MLARLSTTPEIAKDHEIRFTSNRWAKFVQRKLIVYFQWTAGRCKMKLSAQWKALTIIYVRYMFSARKTFTITNEWLLITYMYWWNWIYSDYHYAAETPKLTTSSDISYRRIKHTHWNLYHSISQCCSCGYDAPLTKPGHYIYDSVALFSKPCPLNIHIWRPLSRGVE